MLPEFNISKKIFYKLPIIWWLINAGVLWHFIFAPEINRWILLLIAIQIFLLFIYQRIRRERTRRIAYREGRFRRKIKD